MVSGRRLGWLLGTVPWRSSPVPVRAFACRQCHLTPREPKAFVAPAAPALVLSEGRARPVSACASSGRTKLFATGGADGTVRLWSNDGGPERGLGARSRNSAKNRQALPKASIAQSCVMAVTVPKLKPAAQPQFTIDGQIRSSTAAQTASERPRGFDLAEARADLAVAASRRVQRVARAVVLAGRRPRASRHVPGTTPASRDRAPAAPSTAPPRLQPA